MTSDLIAEPLRIMGKEVALLSGDSDVSNRLREQIRRDDIVIAMGAGSITNFVQQLVSG